MCPLCACAHCVPVMCQTHISLGSWRGDLALDICQRLLSRGVHILSGFRLWLATVKSALAVWGLNLCPWTECVTHPHPHPPCSLSLFWETRNLKSTHLCQLEWVVGARVQGASSRPLRLVLQLQQGVRWVIQAQYLGEHGDPVRLRGLLF